MLSPSHIGTSSAAKLRPTEATKDALIGVGIYTPTEAARLLRIRPAKLVRWLRGHRIGDRSYDPLWTAQVDIGDGRTYLGFRDLMEARIVDRFISLGISAQGVRSAICLARTIIGDDRPLSTNRFRTDGREVFLRVVETDEDGQERERLLNLFRRQYEFRQIIEPLLKTVEFDDHGLPAQWWPLGHRSQIVVDPTRAFGQPIEASSSVPAAILSAAGQREGVEQAALAYDVSPAAIRRSMEFQAQL